MEEKKYKCNEQGVCPVCGSLHLSWGDSDLNGEYLGYEWTCDDCGAEGCEWYKLVFDGHEVNSQTITEDGYSEYNYESVNDYIDPVI